MRILDRRRVAGSGDDGPNVHKSATPALATGFATLRIAIAQYSPSSSDGVGAFRLNCFLSHMHSGDPLVFPGQVRAGTDGCTILR